MVLTLFYVVFELADIVLFLHITQKQEEEPLFFLFCFVLF